MRGQSFWRYYGCLCDDTDMVRGWTVRVGSPVLWWREIYRGLSLETVDGDVGGHLFCRGLDTRIDWWSDYCWYVAGRIEYLLQFKYRAAKLR